MKYNYHFLIVIFITFATTSLQAQYTMVKGKQVMEIGGAFTTYYNYRNYPTGTTDYKKNRFRLRDAQLRMEFRDYPVWEARLDVDFAGLVTATEEGSPTANPFLNDAYVMYKSPFGVDFTLGYQKVQFSRGSMTPILRSAFIKRPALTDGSLFHRRDVGLSASYNFWKQRVNLHAGIFNGIGALSRNNDPSGSVSWMARADVAYPARYRLNDIDRRQVPLPMVVVGGGIYGMKKATDLILGDEYILMVDGLKMHYGLDAAFQYQGFSLQAEWFQMRATPSDTASALLEGKPTSFVQAKGIALTGSYYVKPINTSFSVRYDNLNPNDLRFSDSQKTLAFSAIHYIQGQKLSVRAEYHHRLENWKVDDFRLSLQYLIW